MDKYRICGELYKTCPATKENKRLKDFIGKAVDSAKAYAALGSDNDKMFLNLVNAELKGIDIPVP